MSDQTKNKRIVKNTLLLYFRMVMVMGMGLYTSRVTLNALGIEDFGIYNIVGGIVIAFSFLSNTLGGATSRFITYELGTGNYVKLKKVFNSAITAHVFLAIIIFVLAETIGLWFVYNKLVIPENRFHAALIVYQFSILSSIITIIHIPYKAAVIAHEQMHIFAYASIIEVLLKLFVVIMLTVYASDKLILYGILVFIATLVIVIMYCTYSMKKFEECKIQLKIESSEVKPILFYSMWDMYGNLSEMVRVQGVNVVLNLFFSSLINAAMGIVIQVQNALSIFSESFLTAVRPQIVKSYASNKIDEMQKLVIEASKYSFILLLLISLPLLIENKFILFLWLNNVPDYTVIFCQLSIIYSLVAVIFKPVMFSIHAAGKIKGFSFINGTICIMVLPITYYLLKEGYSPTVPFILNIILVILGWSINLIILKNYIPSFSMIIFLKKSVFVCIYVTILSLIFPMLFVYFYSEGWFRFLGVTVSSSLSIIVIVYFMVLDKITRRKIIVKIRERL